MRDYWKTNGINDTLVESEFSGLFLESSAGPPVNWRFEGVISEARVIGMSI